MKLSTYIQDIERAYQNLLSEHRLSTMRPQYAFDYHPRRPSHILLRERQYSTPPRLAPDYNPAATPVPFACKEILVLLAAFEATYQDNLTPLTPDMVPIIIDTGASISISPYSTDFVGPIQPVQNITLKGIASGLNVSGISTIQYTFCNDDNEVQTITLEQCLHVPQCSVRLLCPQQIGHMTRVPQDGFNATSTNPILTVQGEQTTLQYDSTSNLPLLYTTPGISSFQRYHASLSKLKPPPVHPSHESLNLMKLQRRKLYLHECCAHEGFENLNKWIQDGLFPGVDPSLSSVDDPKCITCNFGKARHRSHNSNVGHISAMHQKPGDGVSSDGMEASTPGCTFTTKGLPSTARFRYASFWIDHATTLVYVTFHTSKAVQELINSKNEFQSWAARYNIDIKSIRADNGVYTAKAFHDSCQKHQQKLTFCAVGAHWQNGIAERFIGTITERARTILLHAMHRWPAVIQENLWPFAVRHAVGFHNASICKGKTQCPFELFTGEPPPASIRDHRVFGCPVYVLHKALQDGNSIGKWSARSWQGVYVGHLSCHSGSIPLVYNPASTHISPQFHVTYDEFFQTVTPSDTPMDDKVEKLFGTSAEWHYKDAYTDNPYPFHTFWSGDTISTTPPATGKKRKRCIQPTVVPVPVNDSDSPSLARGSLHQNQEASLSNAPLHGHVHWADQPNAQEATQGNALLSSEHAQEATQGNALFYSEPVAQRAGRAIPEGAPPTPRKPKRQPKATPCFPQLPLRIAQGSAVSKGVLLTYPPCLQTFPMTFMHSSTPVLQTYQVPATPLLDIVRNPHTTP
jgi:hypothetical protein